jgi:peptidoglycan LD-endopeptidase LytH
MQNLHTALLQNTQNFAPILGYPLAQKNVIHLDLSIKNQDLQKNGLSAYIQKMLPGGTIGIGGYGEHRAIYNSSTHFSGDERCIHLGIDIWVEAETPIYAPLKGKVHSFANNGNEKDYGPTIILEHCLSDVLNEENTENDLVFYTLYGHLTTDSIKYIQVGQSIEKGEAFCRVGFEQENGGWQPHLHLQIISDIQGKTGDFAGVASLHNAPQLLAHCPDAMAIII